MTSKSSLYPTKSTPLSRPPTTTSTTPSNLTFTASLTTLLATSASSTTPQTRPRTSKKPSHSTTTTSNARDSIFTSHNRGTQKRALADTTSSPPPQKHSRTSESIDTATLQRSRRKMEEKARLYASMKRGDYVPPSDGQGHDRETEGLVDFDRKWAEKETQKDDDDTSSGNDDYDSDNGSDDNDNDNDKAPVSYEDEFGRQRTGTKTQAAKELRRRAAQQHARDALADAAARPLPPANLIYGDAVQTGAFNPDAKLTVQMEALARKRDRSMTPPEEVHYDASKEVRAKGVGFFQFSRDREGREREMRGLEAEREGTERGRREREGRREERRRKVEERRRIVGEKRGERLAERFMEGLDERGS